MWDDFFKAKFGKDPSEFKTIAQVNKCVEEKIGHKLEINNLHTDICSSRGSVTAIKEMNVDRIFEAALNKK